MKKLFMSYYSEDEADAEDMATHLEYAFRTEELQVFKASRPESVSPGDPWQDKIIDTLTSPPDAVKRKKLDTLQSRGIDVVEVNVKNEDDLFALFAPRPLDIRFAPRGSKFSRSVEAMGGSQSNSDHKIREVMTALVRCSPEVWREFCQLLQSIGSLDSFHPISRDNPVLGTNADGNG